MDRIIFKLAMPILFAVIFILTGTAEQVQAKNVGASVNDHGNLVMDGTLLTFSFHAREFHNGDVEGSFELKNRLLGVRAHAAIDCLPIEGSEALLSGVLTQVDGIEGPFVGDEIWYRIKDNGEGRGDPPDEISLVIVELPSQPSEIFTCDMTLADILDENPELTDEDLELQDIIGGNIQLRP